jgi:hypothetical protein
MRYFSLLNSSGGALCSRILFVLLLAIVCPISASAQSQSVGIAVDRFGRAHVFDLEKDEVLSVVQFPSAYAYRAGDCSISDDEASAWLTNFNGQVHEIDLTAAPSPALALGTPIAPIANPGIDMVLSPDRAFMVVAGGVGPEPLSVIDVESRLQVATPSLGGTHTSVDICQDGTVLTTSADDTVRFAAIDEYGTISAASGPPNSWGGQNVYCAPGSQTGIALDADGGELNSFSISSPSLKDSLTTGGDPLAAVFSEQGDKVFVRTSLGVEAYAFDPKDGVFGDSLWDADYLFTAVSSSSFEGVDQIMLGPDGSKLYVGGGNFGLGVPVVDASTGEQSGSLTALVGTPFWSPTGLCRAHASADTDGDGILDSADLCPDTVADETTKKFGNNRWIWDGTDWITESNQVPDPDAAFTMEETLGCSCDQVLDELSDRTGLDLDGHYKMGCSSGLLDQWIEGYYHLETVMVPADDADGVVSNTTLRVSEDYQLVAHGAADAVALDLQVNGESVDLGSPNPDRIYMHDLAGEDAPMLLQVGNLDPSGASGAITVEIFLDLR